MNCWHTFELLLAELPPAQTALADTVRGLVYQADPDLFDRLDFEDDRTFLEPALFTYFTTETPRATLEQLLFSYTPTASRPRRLRVYADANGAAYLPGVGWLETAACRAFCDVRWDAAADAFPSGEDGARRTLTSPEVVDGIHVDHRFDALLRRFVADAWAGPGCRIRPLRYAAHVAALGRALSIMRREAPALFAAVRTVTRRIQLYDADRPYSFASLSAHGVAFLNVADDSSEVFFLDDLAHQCGHVMFNALTQEKERFLARPAQTPLREVCRDEPDPRTFYSAFHGLFTYTAILRVLQACEASAKASARQRHESLGRIAFNLRKFGLDLESLAGPGLFTADGRALYELFAGVHDTVSSAYGGAARDLDLSDQPYVFDYARFAARNQGAAARPAALAAGSRG